MEYWKYVCPICGKEVVTGYTIETIKNCIGFTYDCDECGHTVKIEKDLTVTDFGQYLVNSYKEYGMEVKKGQVEMSYINC